MIELPLPPPENKKFRDRAILLGADGLGQVVPLALALRAYGFREVLALVDDPQKYRHQLDSWFRLQATPLERLTDPRALRDCLLEGGLGDQSPALCAFDGLTIPFLIALKSLDVKDSWGIPIDSILRTRSKPHTRLALAGSSTVQWRLLSPNAQRQAAWDAICPQMNTSGPLFVKPAAGFQSTHVSKVRNLAEAYHTAADIRAAMAADPLWSRQPLIDLDGFQISPVEDVLVESAVTGPEYTADGFVSGNQLHFAVQHKEYTYSFPFHGDGAVLSPPDPKAYVNESCLAALAPLVSDGDISFCPHGGRTKRGFDKFVNQVLQRLGFRDWVFHIELIDSGNALELIELNPRIPGGLLALSAGLHLGIDFAEVMVRFLMKMPVVAPRREVTAHVPFYADSLGTISHVDGIELVRSDPCTMATIVTIGGDTVVTNRTRENYAGFVVLRAPTHSGVRKAMSRVMPNIRVIYKK